MWTHLKQEDEIELEPVEVQEVQDVEEVKVEV